MLPALRTSVVVALLAACLAGCQQSVPTPAPTPTWLCTPEAGGAEFECSQRQYDDMVAKDKLYAEAEAVYRKFLAEDLRIARAGGAETATPELLATTAGDFLDRALDAYRQDRMNGITVKQGDRVVISLERLVGSAKAGSIVALRSCVDATSMQVFKAGKFLGHGLITRDELYFARSVDGGLRIIGADGKEVAACGSA